MSNPVKSSIEDDSVLAASPESEVSKLQERQRTAVERAKGKGVDSDDAVETYVHPDLQDLSFGPLGAEHGYGSSHVDVVFR
jgi:hypothetical protein